MDHHVRSVARSRSTSRLVRGIVAALCAVTGLIVLTVTVQANAAQLSTDADLRLSQFLREDGHTAGDLVEQRYVLRLRNSGPAAVPSFGVRVRSDSEALEIRIGSTFDSGTVCRSATTCSHTANVAIPVGIEQAVAVRILVRAGTSLSIRGNVPDEFTDPNTRNNVVRLTTPDDADLRLALDARNLGQPSGDTRTVSYALTAGNAGPATVATFVVRVVSEDASGTIRIGPTPNNGTVCRRVTTCEHTFTGPFPAGSSQPVAVRVSGLRNGDVSIRTVPLGGFVDGEGANNVVRDTLPS
jgi:hypothetical protein